MISSCKCQFMEDFMGFPIAMCGLYLPRIFIYVVARTAQVHHPLLLKFGPIRNSQMAIKALP